MNYLLYGTESFLIDKEIKNIISKNKISEVSISKYDLENSTIEEIINDANTISLFEQKKLIIINNSFIFSKNSNKIDNLNLLEEYLKNKNINVYLIFVNNNEKIDNTKKISKIFQDNGVIKCFNLEKNNTRLIKEMFEDYIIPSECIKLLIDRVGNNLNIIYQEIEKLKILKINNKIITKEDIIENVNKNINLDIFNFIDNIINKNKKESLVIYYEMIKQNQDPLTIISLLANKFRLMYQSSVLFKQGKTEQEISDILGVHKYPVHLAINSSYKYDNKVLLYFLNKLADLDIGIKMGKLDKKLAIELFILEL